MELLSQAHIFKKPMLKEIYTSLYGYNAPYNG